MTKDRPQILLAHADNRGGLAVARSLYRNQYDPVAAVVKSPTFIAHSKVFAPERCMQVCDPGKVPEMFLAEIVEEARRRDCIGVIPITDQALAALAYEFPSDLKFIGPSTESITKVIDKQKHLALAEQLGIPCPKPISIRGLDDIELAIQNHAFPWVLKLSYKGKRGVSAIADFTIWYAHSESEAFEKIGILLDNNVIPIVQEFYSGKINNMCCFAVAGKLIAVHQYISHRSSSSAAIMREIIAPRQDCLDYTRRMLEALDWEGVANVQFIVNDETQDIRYLETNGRFWASTQGSINAGWDFPKWTIDYFLNGKIPQPQALKLGSKTCYHTGDLRFLISTLTGNTLGSLDNTPSKWRSFVNYLFGFGPGISSDVFMWRDPMPSVMDHYLLIKQLIIRLGKKLRGG